MRDKYPTLLEAHGLCCLVHELEAKNEMLQ